MATNAISLEAAAGSASASEQQAVISLPSHSGMLQNVSILAFFLEATRLQTSLLIFPLFLYLSFLSLAEAETVWFQYRLASCVSLKKDKLDFILKLRSSTLPNRLSFK